MEADNQCYVSDTELEPLPYNVVNAPGFVPGENYYDVSKRFNTMLWLLFSVSSTQAISFFYKLYLEYFDEEGY